MIAVNILLWELIIIIAVAGTLALWLAYEAIRYRVKAAKTAYKNVS